MASDSRQKEIRKNNIITVCVALVIAMYFKMLLAIQLNLFIYALYNKAQQQQKQQQQLETKQIIRAAQYTYI